MKWLSLSVQYAHEAVGGTQIYVHRLNLALRRRGIDAVGAYYTDQPARDIMEGVPLIALARAPLPATRMASWQCVPHGIEAFERLIGDVRPDVVHFHASLQIHPPEYFEIARRSGARTLWTYHAPGQTCLQTALLRNGDTPCDGRIEPSRCARCGLVWSGLPRPVAAFFGAVDLSPLTPLVPRRLAHPFERRLGVTRFRARLDRACHALDHWVTHARWTTELLALNHLGGLPALNLPLPPPPSVPVSPDVTPWEGLPTGRRLLYVGRLLDIKGPELAVRALRDRLRGDDVALVLLAPQTDTVFEAGLRALVAAEPRARLMPPRGPSDILAAMAAADAVLVPSVWKETGPYTVLEAQWVGTPVIGADLAGIAERLEEDPSSLLFQPNDVDDLARAMRSLPPRDDDAARAERARRFRELYTIAFDAALARILEIVQSATDPTRISS
jgi:glycosyltransferase involved in cell wall biosynthesis